MADASSDPSFFDVACSQRAYRALLPDPVPEPMIEKILEAGTHAPSAGNSQPWRFVVVQDAEVRRQIGEGARAAWEGFARDRAGDKNGPGFKAVDHWATEGLAQVPVIIVLCGDTSVIPLDQLGSSIFPAAQNILLAAAALGLGSLMSNLPLYAPDGAFARILGLPEHVVPLATLPIGYPEKKLGRPRRKPIEKVTYRDRFGTSW